MREKPLGYRSGWYTADDLRNLRVPEPAIQAAEAQYAEICAETDRKWDAIVAELGFDPRVSGKNTYPEAIAYGMKWQPGQGVTVLAVVSLGTAGLEWEPDESHVWPPSASIAASRYRAPDGALIKPDLLLPGFWNRRDPLRWTPGSVCLFARLWLRGALAPRLTLRASGKKNPLIALEGLEQAGRLGDAERLLKQLAFLKQLSAAGRPSLDSRADGHREEIVSKAEAYKRKSPHMPWWQIAARLKVGDSTLYRYRVAVRGR